jgi:hypothetical protein
MDLAFEQQYAAQVAAANLQPDAPDEQDYLWSDRFPRFATPVEAGGWGWVLSIENQGSENACTTNALTSICEAIRRMLGDVAEQLSRKHLWWHAKLYEGTQGQNVGCSLRDVLKASYHIGLVPETAFPYSTPDTQAPSAEVDALAAQLKTGMYVRCTSSRDLREAIASNHMVYIGMMLENDFYHYRGSDTLQYRGMLKEGGVYVGNHAVFAAAYRTAPAGAIEYYVVNSWDKSWGDGNGGAWISEEVLMHDGFDFWVVTDFAGMKPYYVPTPAPSPEPAPAPAPKPQPLPPAPPIPSKDKQKLFWVLAGGVAAVAAAKIFGVF